jgi:hypothetical protein
MKPKVMVGVVTLFAIMGATTHRTTNPSTDTAAAALAGVRALPFGALTTCVMCDACTGDGHITASNEEALRSGAAHSCFEGISCLAHDFDCESGGGGDSTPILPGGAALEARASLGELWVAITTAEGQDIEVLLAEHSDRLRYETTRQAVQFLACDGSIVASLPLTSAQTTVSSN